MEYRGSAHCVRFRGKLPKQRQQVQRSILVNPKAIAERRSRPVRDGQRLQQHGGLAFEGTAIAHTEQARRGVEAASHAARFRTVQAAREHRGDNSGARTMRKAPFNFIVAPEGVQRCSGHAPGLDGGAVCARECQMTQVAKASAGCAGDKQQFAAPHRTVRAIAGTIKRQPEHGLIEAMFGEHGGNMRVVVLHGYCRHALFLGESCGQARAEKIRMQVMGEGARQHAQCAL